LINKKKFQSIEILLVEDNQGDIDLTLEGLNKNKVRNNVNVAYDGEEALDFLHKRGKFANVVTPDLIILDLNLPKKSGREVLEDVKKTESLRLIPVIILTSSHAERDVIMTYGLNANAYVTKPVDIREFLAVIKSIENFWINIVIHPPASK